MSRKVGEAVAYFDAVLFDVDGTLIHSSPGILSTMEYTFAQMGITLPESELKKFLGPPLRVTFGKYCQTEERIEQAVDTYRSRYAVDGQYQCRLFPGVEEMLRTLKAQGVILCTATSKPVKVVEPMLERLGIAPLFTMIGGASMDASLDTKTAVVNHVLHQPFLAGKRVLMAGDRKDDVKGGRDCGLTTAAVLYGYGSREELELAAPSVLLEDCSALTNFILEGPAGLAKQEVVYE